MALCAARRNALRHGVAGRIRWVQGHWADALDGPFDGIVSNPPYVPTARVDRLPPDVRQEPRLSLDGGRDGLALLRRLLREAPRLLTPGGILACECGEDQVTRLVRMAGGLRWTQRVRPLRDLAGRPRGALIHRVSIS
jgi:release factor glutamine methyltransferase